MDTVTWRTLSTHHQVQGQLPGLRLANDAGPARYLVGRGEPTQMRWILRGTVSPAVSGRAGALNLGGVYSRGRYSRYSKGRYSSWYWGVLLRSVPCVSV